MKTFLTKMFRAVIMSCNHCLVLFSTIMRQRGRQTDRQTDYGNGQSYESEGWSLPGQVYSTFFCLSSSSLGLQMTFRSILPCCSPMASLISLVFLLPT